MDRVKPMFRFRESSATAKQKIDLAVQVQRFFFLLKEERLSPEQASRRYPDEIEALQDAMMEIGLAVDEPVWFTRLLGQPAPLLTR